MTIITNTTGISLPLAVWLAVDPYTNGSERPEFEGKNLISATSLLKPIRQTVLAARVNEEDAPVDIQSRVKARIGHAIHDSIEKAWTEDPEARTAALVNLGIPEKAAQAIDINPEDAEDSDFPVLMEQRHFREVDMGNGLSVVVSGQFDMSLDHECNDFKITSTFTYTSGNKEEDYRLQGSVYRWLAPHIIKSDTLVIQHIFLDWIASKAKSVQGYPPSPVMDIKIDLMSLEETDQWVRNRIKEIAENQSLPEEDVVRCNDKELWRTAPSYKYYSKPETAAAGGRASKVFPSMAEAQNHLAAKGKGTVLTIPGQVKACAYCPAFSACSQKNEYEL